MRPEPIVEFSKHGAEHADEFLESLRPFGVEDWEECELLLAVMEFHERSFESEAAFAERVGASAVAEDLRSGPPFTTGDPVVQALFREAKARLGPEGLDALAQVPVEQIDIVYPALIDGLVDLLVAAEGVGPGDLMDKWLGPTPGSVPPDPLEDEWAWLLRRSRLGEKLAKMRDQLRRYSPEQRAEWRKILKEHDGWPMGYRSINPRYRLGRRRPAPGTEFAERVYSKIPLPLIAKLVRIVFEPGLAPARAAKVIGNRMRSRRHEASKSL